MSTNLLTNIDWSNPMTIGITAGVIVILGVSGYLWWAWSKKQWPF